MTYTIGTNSLKTICPSLRKWPKRDLQALADSLGDAMHKFGITSSRRAAMFIAQIAHESGEFKYRRELWGPTDVQRSYGSRMGNQGMGDAFDYRGGGWIQLTGKFNYRNAGQALNIPLLEKPHLMNQLKYCSLVSAWWWKAHGCNQAADTGKVDRVTRIINGGYNGLIQRKRYYRRARPLGRFLRPRKKR